MYPNALCQYTDPVEYRKALDKASHCFDEHSCLLQDNVKFFFDQLEALKGCKSELNELSGDDLEWLRHFLSLSSDASKEEISETINAAERELRPKIDQIQRSTIFITNILLPLLGVFQLLLERKAIRQLDEGTVTLLHLTKEEVADLLFNTTSFAGTFLVRSINGPNAVCEALLDTYNRGEKDTFIEILGANDTCDCSVICRYANTEEAKLSAGFAFISHSLLSLDLDDDKEQLEDLAERASYSVGNEIAERLDLMNLGGREWTLGSLASKVENYYELFRQVDESYLQKICLLYLEGKIGTEKPEQRVIESILTRPDGIDLYNRYKAEFEANQQVEEQSLDATVENEEVQGINQSPDLDYSNPGFVKFEEFKTMEISGKTAEYYFDSKTYTAKESEVRCSFVKTTKLYELLCLGKLIEHTPDNYYSFLFLMTGRKSPDRQIAQIEFIGNDRSQLTYFLGRAINKRHRVTGLPLSDDPDKKKTPRYANGIWKSSYVSSDNGRKSFFHLKEEIKWSDDNVRKRISEEARYNGAIRDPFKQKCNELCSQLFTTLE